jgi:hypothetical protein
LTTDFGPFVVFLGPTLALADAHAVLPEAVYLPPARCGDLLRALRLKPRAVLLVDGTYERTPAVWHKEIAVALERGIPVLGAASMGALRAAEMAEYGMIGIGGIFEDYRDGRLVDDDEVAVIHSASGESLSTALVDIRATVERGLELGEVSEALAESILAVAKGTFYPERSLKAVLNALPESPERTRFARWVARGGQVHRKRCDALSALRALAEVRHRAPSPALPVPRTAALRVLSRHVACSAFHGDSPALPKPERVVLAARFLGNAYRDAKRLAELLAALWELAPGHAERDASDWWPAAFDTGQWAADNDCSPAEHEALRQRIRLVAGFEHQLLSPPGDAQIWLAWRALTRESRYHRWLNAIDDVASADGERVRSLLVRAWRAIDLFGRRVRLVPQTELLQALFDGIRFDLRLRETEQVDGWVAKHGLDLRDLGALLVARFRWHGIASEAQGVALGVEREDESVFWLLDALRLSGLYPRARALLEMDAASRARVAIMPRTLSQALERDFPSEEPGALRHSLARLDGYTV